MAASVLIALGTTFIFLRVNHKTSSPDKLVQKVKTLPEKIRESVVTDANNDRLVKSDKRFTKARPIKKLTKESIQLPLSSTILDVYAKLADSSSSSSRLSAILDMDKAGRINNEMLDRLAKTLNHDENSNVRLAALSVLEKYSYDAHVSALLVGSLNTQNDPMVQLGLVTTLGKMKNLNINDKLYALANDPSTFGAVKDEAYSILLKEDKL